jgi:hypothetical protein
MQLEQQPPLSERLAQLVIETIATDTRAVNACCAVIAVGCYMARQLSYDQREQVVAHLLREVKWLCATEQ